MRRRQARATQTDIARAIRAAQQTGARAVRVEPDGTILIEPNKAKGENPQLAKERIAEDREAIL